MAQRPLTVHLNGQFSASRMPAPTWFQLPAAGRARDQNPRNAEAGRSSAPAPFQQAGSLHGSSIANGGVGYCCLAEVRMYEPSSRASRRPFLKFGDTGCGSRCSTVLARRSSVPSTSASSAIRRKPGVSRQIRSERGIWRPRPRAGALLTTLVALGPLSTDLLPAVAADAGDGLSDRRGAGAAPTLSVFLPVSPLPSSPCGPLSDRFGRRPVMLGGW